MNTAMSGVGRQIPHPEFRSRVRLMGSGSGEQKVRLMGTESERNLECTRRMYFFRVLVWEAAGVSV